MQASDIETWNITAAAEHDVYERLAQIRDIIGGNAEVTDPLDLDAVRAALLRLFESFIVFSCTDRRITGSLHYDRNSATKSRPECNSASSPLNCEHYTNLMQHSIALRVVNGVETK